MHLVSYYTELQKPCKHYVIKFPVSLDASSASASDTSTFFFKSIPNISSKNVSKLILYGPIKHLSQFHLTWTD